MSEEPLNCPFCGGTAEQNENHTWCMNCEANAPRGDWKNRPEEDALRARIDSLEKEVAPFREPYFNGLSMEAIANLAKKFIRLNAKYAELEEALEKAQEGAGE